MKDHTPLTTDFLKAPDSTVPEVQRARKQLSFVTKPRSLLVEEEQEPCFHATWAACCAVMEDKVADADTLTASGLLNALSRKQRAYIEAVGDAHTF